MLCGQYIGIQGQTAKNSRSFPLPFKRMKRAAAAAFLQMSILLKKKRQANCWPFFHAFRIPAGSLLANIQRLITRCAVHLQLINFAYSNSDVFCFKKQHSKILQFDRNFSFFIEHDQILTILVKIMKT